MRGDDGFLAWGLLYRWWPECIVSFETCTCGKFEGPELGRKVVFPRFNHDFSEGAVELQGSRWWKFELEVTLLPEHLNFSVQRKTVLKKNILRSIISVQCIRKRRSRCVAIIFLRRLSTRYIPCKLDLGGMMHESGERSVEAWTFSDDL